MPLSSWICKVPQSICKEPRTYTCHPVSRGTVCGCMTSVFLKLKKCRRKGREERGSLRKILCLLLYFSNWQVFVFSPVSPGNQVLPPGASLGNGLTPEAAKDLGLPAGIAVAASLIDAHAVGLGNHPLLHGHYQCCPHMDYSQEPKTLLSYFKASKLVDSRYSNVKSSHS